MLHANPHRPLPIEPLPAFSTVAFALASAQPTIEILPLTPRLAAAAETFVFYALGASLDVMRIVYTDRYVPHGR